MNRLKASFIKELLILSRDRAGLAMLFVMPIALVLIMTLLQESTFNKLNEKQLPVLIMKYVFHFYHAYKYVERLVYIFHCLHIDRF